MSAIRGSRRKKERGSSLLELMMAVALLAVGLLSMATGFYGASRLNEVTRNDYDLSQGLQNAVGVLRGAPLASLTTSFGPTSGRQNFYLNSDSTLAYIPPAGSQVQGTFEFLTNESTLPAALPGLASPFDLNANGALDTSPIPDYKVLPCRITFTVNRPEGARTLAIDMILAPPIP